MLIALISVRVEDKFSLHKQHLIFLVAKINMCERSLRCFALQYLQEKLKEKNILPKVPGS